VIAKSLSKPGVYVFVLAVLFCTIGITVGAEPIQLDQDTIVAAFAKSHDGFSTDELLIRDDLREKFLTELTTAQGIERTPELERTALLKLLQLRKAGKLSLPSTRRGKPVDEGIQPIAEIAARVVTDRYRVTTDTMLADLVLRQELQHEAELIVAGIDAYAVRKSVLGLRKKRSLRPELVLQVANWDRRIETFSLPELKEKLSKDELPTEPGVYLFRNSEGYLYIGEAADLAARLREHTTVSDRQSLAEYLASTTADDVTVELHIFPGDSPASQVTIRRAYESELIRSREPKFNVRP
jgi:GIY-YIG catalytic domain